MLRAYKYRLYPNQEQREKIKQNIGACRWIYNYALEKKVKAWTVEHKNLSRFDIQKDLHSLKEEKETKWLGDVYSQSLQASLGNLDKAYTKFFKDKRGFPKFKSKHKSRQSYSIPQNVRVDFGNNKIKLPKITPIRIIFHRKFEGIIKTCTVSMTRTNKYFISILVEDGKELPKLKKVKNAIGIDMGITHFLTTSNGNKVDNPKYLQKEQRKLARAQKRLSKKVKGSERREKAKLKVARIHEKIVNRRHDFLHKVSRRLVNESQIDTFVFETLSVGNMLKNHRLAKNISDVAWSTFFGFTKYKAEWDGKNIIRIGQFEPSSKLCNNCGSINRDLKLSDREWTCLNCGSKHDRDENAAKNIRDIGINTKIKIRLERPELTLMESRCT